MSRRIFVLATYDPSTGIASRPAGVLGVEKSPEGWEHYASFVPYEEGADVWRERLATVSVPIEEAVAAWDDGADGIAVALEELEVAPPDGVDLATAVELVVDELLALRARLDTGRLEA